MSFLAFRPIVLTIGLLHLVAACAQEKHKLSTRQNAESALKIPAVSTEIQTFIQRNSSSKSGLFYINAIQRGDSVSIKISSLVYKSEADELKPCDLTHLNGEWILVKTSDCNHKSKIDSLLNQHAPTSLIDNTKPKYTVLPNGDTLLPGNVFYHPDVLTIYLYKARVVAVKSDSNG